MKAREPAATEICKRLANGETLRGICSEEGMPAASTVCEWVLADPAFAERYARARSIGLDVLADEIQHIADTPLPGQIVKETEDGVETTTKDMLEHRRLQVDARKWLLSKLRPDKYGDRTALEHSGPGGEKLEIVVTHVGDKGKNVNHT